MYIVEFNGIVDAETKKQIELLLSDKGQIKCTDFPKKLIGTELQEKLMHSQMSKHNNSTISMLDKQIENLVLDFGKLSFSEGLVLKQYISNINTQ